MQLPSTQRAFSNPDIVSLIVEYCVILTGSSSPSPAAPTKDPRLAEFPAHYATLRTTSLISRSFYVASQKLLSSSLVFVHGTPQLEQWLLSIEIRKQNGRMSESEENETVYLTDAFPFQQGKRQEGFKWDYDVVGKVLEKVKGCNELHIGFMGQKSVPTEWLVGENLKDLETLQLGSPLATADVSDPSSLKPSFKALRFFCPSDKYPQQLSRDWAPTFAFLSRASIRISHLNLTRFPFYPRYLVPALYPFGPNLIELSLPHFHLDSSSMGPFFVFAQSCISLVRLSISCVTPLSIPALHLLQALPPRLARLKIDYIQGSLAGHYDWVTDRKAEEEHDTFAKLLKIVREMKLKSHEALSGIQFGTAKWFLPEHQRDWVGLMKETGMGLPIETMDNTRTELEQKRFNEILQTSLRHLLVNAQYVFEPTLEANSSSLSPPDREGVPIANGGGEQAVLKVVEVEQGESHSKVAGEAEGEGDVNGTLGSQGQNGESEKVEEACGVKAEA
ncbi:uncharacterized protein JCM6883_005846 [Sporobolomyces salmoneus]|uniref:uncharacterized protein n=1 Tax=Sporobolomyces salmoneus TaxID=183962 RepID=UPI00316B530A